MFVAITGMFLETSIIPAVTAVMSHHLASRRMPRAAGLLLRYATATAIASSYPPCQAQGLRPHFRFCFWRLLRYYATGVPALDSPLWELSTLHRAPVGQGPSTPPVEFF